MTTIKRLIWSIIYWTLGTFSPQTLVSLHFRRSLHHSLNWKNPRDINEKIQWLKFNSDTSTWTDYADKYRVRKHIEETGLGYMLIPLIGIWEKAEDINWNVLPNKFVMKTNHGCGDVLICNDKSSLDIKIWTKHFSRLMKKKFGKKMGEPHYNKIRPCIIAEELLDSTKQQVKSTSPVDYKIWSFNGKPAYICTYHNRTKESCELGIYDLEWNFHPEFIKPNAHYTITKNPIPRPKALKDILNAASKLSKGYAIVRVDFYVIDDKPYFGEMTFTPSAGFNCSYTQEFLNILGDICNIHANTKI